MSSAQARPDSDETEAAHATQKRFMHDQRKATTDDGVIAETQNDVAPSTAAFLRTARRAHAAVALLRQK